MGQPAIPSIPAETSFSGYTILIVAANTGLGFEAARQFLALGTSRMIVTTRTPQKSAETVKALRDDAEVKAANPDALIEAFEVDLDNYGSAKAFCERLKEEVNELDVLLNNGGMNMMSFGLGKEGHERLMQINVYTSLFISLALLPLLRDTSKKHNRPAHLSWTGSYAQERNKLRHQPLEPSESVLENYDDPQKYLVHRRYGDSKLAINALVRQLGARLDPNEVIVNNFCPGVVRTGIYRHLPLWVWLPVSLWVKCVDRGLEAGARTFVFASALKGPETHGKFLNHNEVHVRKELTRGSGEPILDSQAGKEFAEMLWKELVDEFAKVDEDVGKYAKGLERLDG